MLVMQVIYTMCQDPQTVVDLYVNYDCSLDSSCLFELMVEELSRVSQVRYNEVNWLSPTEAVLYIIYKFINYLGKN